MSPTVAIVVATFGEPVWAHRAALAVASARAQQPDELHAVHAATLADARNAAGAETTADWLCHLDADDRLEEGYLDAMRAAIVEHGPGALYAPRIRFVRDGVADEPTSIAHRDMDRLNPCVVGTLIERQLVADVGGWWPERAWEDWSLFRRAWLAGARLIEVPDAVYRITVNPEGRNSTVHDPQRLSAEIRRSHRHWAAQRRRAHRAAR